MNIDKAIDMLNEVNCSVTMSSSGMYHVSVPRDIDEHFSDLIVDMMTFSENGYTNIAGVRESTLPENIVIDIGRELQRLLNLKAFL